jgi:D-3-phosphoglycerate dehydrogenase
MKRLIVTDSTFEPLDIESSILEPLGCQVVGRQFKKPDDLATIVADADFVATQFAPINADVIAAMKRVRLIVRYGIGVDNVDLTTASAKGIPVCNVPDYCIDEVADHTLGFILAATRCLIPNCTSVRAGHWRLAVPVASMRALRDLTVGIVGFGRIGRAVMRRLLPCRCVIQVHDPAVAAAEIERFGCVPASLEELLSASDLVTLHCPSLPETRGLINRRTIELMTPGAILINVGRGDLVVTNDLIDALRMGRLGAAALDVCNPEPIAPDSPLLVMDNVIVTAHVASASAKADRTLRESVAQTIACALRGDPLPIVVNRVVRHGTPSVS